MDLTVKEKIVKIIEQHIKDLDLNNFKNVVYESLAMDIFDDLTNFLNVAEITIPPECTVLPRNFCVDESKKPSYLRDAHFIAWLDKFNETLRMIGLEDWKLPNLDVRVVFSNEQKRSHYGSLTIEELKEIIRDTWGTNEEIEEILKKIHSEEDYRNLIQGLMGTIRRTRSDDDIPNPELLYSYLEELEFDMPILGQYVHAEKMIILYVPNIGRAAAEHKNTASREIEKVFIHELFHAYHYYNDKGELVSRHDYTSKVVKESLASAFEWFYCIENKINGDVELKDSWLKYSVMVYPYSGAYRLLSEIGRFTGQYRLDNQKLRDVFAQSLKDMDGALRALLDPYIFYRIKNSVQIREKAVKTAISTTNLRAAFDTLMKKDAIGIIAQREIPAIIRKNRLLISRLLDTNYCYKTFNMTGYPVLSTAPMLDRSGRPRSYADPVYRIGNTDYYLCAQWDKRQIGLLLDWIWENR